MEHLYNTSTGAFTGLGAFVALATIATITILPIIWRTIKTWLNL